MATAEQADIARLTEEYDWHDPAFTPDVAEIVNTAIREGPAVSYSPAHGGMWIIARYRQVKAALRDHATFSSGSGVHFPRADGMPKFTPIDYDPPQHAAIRALMAPPVHPDEVERMRAPMRALAAELIEPIAARGHGELFEELAQPLAIRAVGLAIGLSEPAQLEIRDLTQTMWKHLSKDSDAGEFWPAYHALLSQEIKRAKDQPGEYYLSRLAEAEIDGEPIPDDLLYSIIVSYCVAGHDNTMNTISRMLSFLAGRPELQRRLKAEPDLAGPVVEETLRRWCPTDRFTRVATRDVTIEGVTIPEGGRVVLLFDAANRDPEKFEDPESFCPERGNARQHLSFGNGIHHCLGVHLARMEFRAVLTELARHPLYHLTEEPYRYFENGRHVMFERIPVRFDPAEG